MALLPVKGLRNVSLSKQSIEFNRLLEENAKTNSISGIRCKFVNP